MLNKLKTQLRIPAESRFLTMIQGHVRDLATIAGLSPKEILALELATEEIFLNIRDHAYPGDIPGDVLVNGEIGDRELRLDFHDQGLPFDPSLLPRTDDPAGPHASSGLGLKLIHHAADEVHWINRGRQGKGLCLVKRLPRTAEAMPQEARAEIAQAPAHTYAIRPMRPDEALQVTRIFWMAYGYSYKNETFYRPEGLVELVGSGRLISYVAVTETGEVAAHAGLLRPEPVPMAEMAVLVVSPAHRGRRLMDGLLTALTEKGKELGLYGIAYNPVTSHAASHRQVMELGGKPCGLELAACPPRQFRGMRLDNAVPQRESYLHCFSYLKPPSAAVVHVPARHQEMAVRIFAQFDRSLTLASPGEGAEPGNYKVSFDRGLLKGSIRILRAEARQWPEILRAAIDLLDIAGAEVVSLDLPLAQPTTPLLCERAEAEGFFFVGIWPHGAQDGDVLRLMRLGVPLNLEQVRVRPEFGSDLLAYVGDEMARAARVVAPRGQTP